MVRQSYALNLDARREHNKAYNKSNPEMARKAVAAYKKRHPERIAAYAEKNKVRRSEYHREWYAKNLEDKRAKNRQWSKKNPARHLAICAARRASELRAMPAWADQKAIDAIYEEAQRISRETGVVHHVDHIVPLRGKTVCGLHVETNLQIITAYKNLSKGARFAHA
jgi:flagellum-specific peptidoglycan hydrolase FlgJ